MKNRTQFAVVAFLLSVIIILISCKGNVVESPAVTTEAVSSTAYIDPTETLEPPEIVEPAPGDYVEIPFAEPLVVSSECKGNGIKEIVAIDRLNVRVTLCQPDSAFLSKIALPPLSIAPREWLESYANEVGQEKLLFTPIGTGPYYLESWDRGDRIVFKRFDDYWDGPAKTETVVFRWEDSDAQRLLELQPGAADYITRLNPDSYTIVENDGFLQYLPVLNPDIMYLGMINTFEPWNNASVRKAIAIGIDRQRIVDNFYPAGAEVASHFVPCSIPNGCAGESWYAFDVETANTLLDEAGLPRDSNGFRFTTSIYYRDVYRSYLPVPGPVAVEIQTQLRDNLGINANVVVIDLNEFLYEATTGLLDGLYLLGWEAHYLHAMDFLDTHFGRSSLQFGNPYPGIYEILEKTSQTPDSATSADLFAQINNAIRESVPMVPIAHSVVADAALADVSNAQSAVLGSPDLWMFIPGERDTLTYLQIAQPVSLYCADETDNETLDACKMVSEGLYKYNAVGEAVPALATGCVANGDATVYTCSLREGVKFHDGSTLDANDVVRSWDASMNVSSEYHLGNTGAFEYLLYLFGSFMNLK